MTQLLRMKIPIDVLQTWVLEQIAAKNEKGNDETISTPDRSDFIEKVLALKKVGKATENDVLQAAFVNIGAGSDTTSISLSSVIYGLCQNPTAAKKLQEEIDTFIAKGKLSDPVTFEETGRMPYLQACIKEGLRIHPAVGRPLLRVVPAGGAKLAGQYFPDGVSSLSFERMPVDVESLTDYPILYSPLLASMHGSSTGMKISSDPNRRNLGPRDG